jgi:hypothetical protein
VPEFETDKIDNEQMTMLEKIRKRIAPFFALLSPELSASHKQQRDVLLRYYSSLSKLPIEALRRNTKCPKLIQTRSRMSNW